MSKAYYCPICGQPVFPNQEICPYCINYITPIESIHESTYYTEKSVQMYGDKSHTRQILIEEEASHNPLYNPNTTTHNAEEEFKKRTQVRPYGSSIQEENRPKCPTCGSENVEKISTTSKVLGTVMFGLLSKTARSQFKCNNCGYKW